MRLERQLGKQAILERYLNTVYFGAGAWGIEAAAERYFGVRVQQLDAAQAALLAGLIRNPRALSPFAHADAARNRRHDVLAAMAANHHLDDAAARAADATPLPSAPQHPQPEARDAFTDEVVRSLMANDKLGATPKDRISRIINGGLTIHTTLDPGVQAAAERAVTSNIPPSPFTAAVAAIDPSSGAVRALVGRTTDQADGFDLATQGARQAGSSFKMITLAAAIDAGRSPLDHVDASAPCVVPVPGGAPWPVDNYEPGSGGDVTLWDATVHSFNCAYARLVTDLGASKVVDMAHRLGVTRPLQAVPSITLGTQDVSPLDMATVASTLAADGVRHDPFFVSKVEDASGQTVVDTGAPAGTRAIPPQVARSTTTVLQDVINRGTGRAADIGRPAAGKTGTTEQWSDAWFVGYTPNLAAAVWMGSPTGRVPMTNVGGVNVAGGTYPARTWGAFMRDALAPVAPAGFPAPDQGAWGTPGRIGPEPPPPPTTTTKPPETTTTEKKKKKHHGD
jgi:penicillin-binding protein 1A